MTLSFEPAAADPFFLADLPKANMLSRIAGGQLRG